MTGDDPFKQVHPKLRGAVERRGFTSLTAVQTAIVEAATSDRNLRVSSETGSGKTVAIGFILAAPLIDALERAEASKPPGPLALLIAPTRELAAQVCEELAWLYADVPGVHTGVVTGGTDIGRERRMLSRRPQILVGTPGRLLDHIRNGAVNCDAIAHVVLDEADQMLDMGFRDELEAIVEALPKKRRSHLVSATFPQAVRRLADAFQQGDSLQVAGTALGSANQDIEHIVHLVRTYDRYDALVNILLAAQGERCLVFVKRREEAAEVAERLAENGFSAMPLSGDLAQAQRTRTLNAFRNGTVRTLVATDVAARGIDVADIAMVIHGDPPLEAATYTHRSGRTGRAGRKGRSIILVPPNMQFRVRRLLRNGGIEAAWDPVPTPAKIKKTSLKRARVELHEALANADEPTELQQAYAAKLLSDYDPAKLITALLRLAEPRLPCEPRDVATVKGDDSPRAATASGGFARFSINWGHQGGATPSRLLAHVCRRGNVSSQFIGALDIGADTATFEVGTNRADAFEVAAREPDQRDPKIQIRRMGPGEAGPERGPNAHPNRRGRFGGQRRDRDFDRGGSAERRGHHRDRESRSGRDARSRPRDDGSRDSADNQGARERNPRHRRP